MLYDLRTLERVTAVKQDSRRVRAQLVILFWSE